jgi:hypothetical protein
MQNADPAFASVAVPLVPAFAITTPIAPLLSALAGLIAHPAAESTANALITVPVVASLQIS